jgi:hypothetical protein
LQANLGDLRVNDFAIQFAKGLVNLQQQAIFVTGHGLLLAGEMRERATALSGAVGMPSEFLNGQ